MKARVSIRIPKMGASANNPAASPNNPAASPTGAAAAASVASRRKKLLAYTAPKITDVLGQEGGSSSASLIDHHNLPKAWHRGGHGSQGERADAEMRRRARKTHVRPMKGRATSKMGASQSVPELPRSTMSETSASATSAADPPSSPATSPMAAAAPTLNTTTTALNNTSTTAHANSILPAWQNQPAFLRLDQSKMPLEAFDNAELEQKSGTPEEWLKRCRTGRVRYYADGVWRWRRVTINSYVPETGRFNVTFDGPAERSLRLTKNVRRLDLLFSDEDREAFEERRVLAQKYRDDFKSALRLKAYLQSNYINKLTTVAPIPEESVQRIVDQAYGGSHNAKAAAARVAALRAQAEEDGEKPMGPTLSERLLETVRTRFDMAQGTASLRHELRTNEELRKQCLVARLPQELLPEEVEKAKTSAPTLGTIGHVMPNNLLFQSRRTSIAASLSPGNPVILGLCLFTEHTWLSKCDHLRYVLGADALWDMIAPKKRNRRSLPGSPLSSPKAAVSSTTASTSTSSSPLPCTLSTLDELQQAAANNAAKCLKEDWRDRVLANTLDSFESVKGIDQFAIETEEQFDDSPIKTIVYHLELRMVQRLRNMVHASAEEWCDCIASGGIVAATPMLINSPIVFTELQIPTDGSLVPMFSPPLSKVQDVICGVIDKIDQAALSLPSLICADLLAMLSIDQAAPIINPSIAEGAVYAVTRKARKKLADIVAAQLEGARRLVEEFGQYTSIMRSDPSTYWEEWSRPVPDIKKSPKKAKKSAGGKEDQPEKKEEEQEEQHGGGVKMRPRTLEEYETEIHRLVNIANLVETGIVGVGESTHLRFGAFEMRCESAKAILCQRAKKLATALVRGLVDKATKECKILEAEYAEVFDRVSDTPTDETALVSQRTFLRGLDMQLLHMYRRVKAAIKSVQIRSVVELNLSEDEFQALWRPKLWPNKIIEAKEAAALVLEHKKTAMIEILERDVRRFEAHLEKLAEEAEECKTLSDVDELKSTVERTEALVVNLELAQDKMQELNARLGAFDWDPNPFITLSATEQTFAPFAKLWSDFSDFRASRNQWLNESFLQLDGVAVRDQVEKTWVDSYKMVKRFKNDSPEVAKVCQVLRDETTKFKELVPIIEALGNKAMKQRHWAQLADETGCDIVPDEFLTLQSMLDVGLQDHWDKVDEISVVATKQFGLETKLNDLVEAWAPMDLLCLPYKESGTFIVGGVEDVFVLLDDQIVTVQTMLGSSFIKNIKGVAQAFERKLVYAQDVLDEWLAVQRTWMYLTPIFSSPDIMRQMPTEGRRFQAVDSMWRKTMATINENSNMMHIASNEKLLKGFKEANTRLDQIQKGLEDYLEIKRLAFSRFFFLSNDELLEILSQTKDPTAVQPYLNKIFEGIGKVKFRHEETGNKGDQQIIAMISGEKEIVQLTNIVDPNKGQNRGNVENWLKELQAAMRFTLKDQVMKSMEDYTKTDRVDWFWKWPAQCVLNVSQLYWTQEVEDALAKNGRNGLKTYIEDVLNKQLNDVVQVVRGKITKLQRRLMQALCTIDVHAKAAVQEVYDANGETKYDFEWLSQLRYYWEDMPDDYFRYNDKEWPSNLIARILNAFQMYGYEYLGCSGRLVITPLTDRCYRTLMGAVALMYGGAPAGPAGTGKTETTKDLSKACAIQCIVLNCSPEFDYKAMGKFFKGLAQAGSWSCFDEFNRIILEVLSVIAQQILTLQNAKRARVKTFEFEGTTLTLNPDANVFITMNPGYAGRQELPDNLKALFRPCAMMVPDYALIAEVMLFAKGFLDGTTLARKLTQVLQLSSELLSSQKHYDYGMRAVFSILVRAGNLRLELGEMWTEDIIVLSAIVDVNLPKFTSNDIPLFKGIVTDLFPGTDVPTPDYGELIPKITDVCERNGLQPTESFIASTIQLFETVQVRHGLMVVGQTFSGKTSVFRTLQQALTELEGEDYPPSVNIHTINPKSVASTQLYGSFDPNTHEWTNGVLAIIYRTASKDLSGTSNWLVFDGPVDTLWIESMNTVLDDNKKLCLVSGEIIKMSPYMRMMFEPPDLDEASPATVSRVGVVFMEPSRLGWEPILESWLARLPASTLLPEVESMRKVMHWLLLPCMFFVTEYCKRPTPITVMEMANNAFRLFTAMTHDPLALNEMRKEAIENDGDVEAIPVAELPIPKGKDLAKYMENTIIFCILWSFGGVVDKPSRAIFDDLMRSLLTGTIREERSEQWNLFMAKNPGYEGSALEDRKSLDKLPDKGTLFDFRFNRFNFKWEGWMKSAARDDGIPDDAKFNDIIIPTVDTVRSEFVMKCLIENGCHVLVTGETGTGKSVSVKAMLKKGLDQNAYSQIFVQFSAQTTENQTQDIIDGKLGKRRKGVFGPPPGYTSVVFVDDLNMPKKEEYGAQPPIELLRTWMDHNGWYDRFDPAWAFRNIVSVQFVAAMGPPGGGRSNITQRYVRHFNMINYVPFDDSSLVRIFEKITGWFLGKSSGLKNTSFPSSVRKAGETCVTASIKLYNAVAEKLLPTPLKSHYTFNLRDLAKVFQGLSQADPLRVDEPSALYRMWGHECSRVFQDRLVSVEDQGIFQTCLDEVCKADLKNPWEKIHGDVHPLLYGNFADPQIDTEQRTYVEMNDHVALQEACTEYLDDFNATSKKPMDLVLFMDAISHCSRIARIIQQPYGNALLVGVGGSGRRSLTELAVSLSDMKIFQIEISKTYGMNEWRDDLKILLRSAGEEAKDMVFLFADTQIKKEDFVEDINNILNTGEVPNLFASDEKSAICEALQKPAKEAGYDDPSPAELLAFFNKRTREHLHVILAFSPVGDAFRTRLRMFPSLVNCCTIDWFMGWPEAALRSVAMYFLDNEDVGLEKTVLNAVVETCVDMQSRVTKLSDKYLNELRRYYYVTPTSYLGLIQNFKMLFDAKRVEISMRKGRYQNGLTKILQTASQVGTMQEELKALQPQLKVAQKETAEKLVVVTKEEKEVAAQAKVVQGIVEECNKTKASAEAMKSECEEMLAVAIPALKAAEKALKSLKKSDIVEVKNFKLPPHGVLVTMEAVCYMLGEKGKKTKEKDENGKYIIDFWDVSKKKILANPKFLPNLLVYDRDNIDPEIVEKVTKFCERDDFTPDKVKKASVAAAGLCLWVHAMMSYDKVAKVVAPKRAALAQASSDLAAAETDLASRQSELKIVQDNLANLQAELQATMARKDKLVKDVKQCADRLERAEKLISGLGGEKARWAKFVEELQVQYDNVTGDILISSGVVAYLGCFVQSYRTFAVDAWCNMLKEKKITCSDPYSIIETLGEPVKIRSWTIDKLPNDSFSIANAIMLNLSKRWPLMIDPQMQANLWVKTMEEKNDLKVCRQSQSTFVRTIENAVQFGRPVLLEDVPENLDPVLESVLLMNVVKVGGQPSIRVGDNMVTLEAGFKLYMTTRLPNPHYPPETCVKINLLNFMATEAGLMDQMLGVTVGAERPDLEKKREELVIQDAENKRQLKEIEDTILELLAKAEGNILDDSVLIETLSQSKVTSNKIEKQVAIAARTSAKINKTRQSYEPVALRVAILFFCIADLAAVDPMYQYSLNWYVNLFLLAIQQAEKGSSLEARLTALVDKFTDILYVNVCRSLFEKDKLLFSFLLAMKVMVREGRVEQEHLRYFLSGNTAVELPEANPVNDPEDKWLSDKSWGDLLSLSNGFGELFAWVLKDFKYKPKNWRRVCEATDPMGLLKELFEADHPELSAFHFLTLLRCVRPDMVIGELTKFVSDSMGPRFVDPPSFDLGVSFDVSTCETPLIMVLTSGADPMTVLLRLATEMGYTADNGRLFSISLGQGQGPRAENAVANAKDRGTWVVLQNCHLFESWLSTLQRMCEEINIENTHENFRLWLTSMPTETFPVSVLQNGVKMTLEPPRGMRQSLQGSYLAIEPSWLEDSPHPATFKKLVFALCFFHATVGERIKFGPLGWNITYGFSVPDLSISLDQMKLFLDEYDEVPWKMLNYCTGQCNYGGRVTDDKDRRCITHILRGFYTPEVLKDEYRFSKSGTFYAPPEGDHASYLTFIRQLPLAEGPECYGLHDNAAITSAILETTSTLGKALSLQPRSAGGAAESWESKLSKTASDLETRMPELFDIERILVAYPTKFEDSMNTILTQEVERFNNLLKLVKTTLRDVQRALLGEMVMSEELEAMGDSLVNGLVPNMWSAKSYPSLKPLGPWTIDFLERLTFMNTWVENDSPVVYWISGFFFTQSFLTGTRQNYARATSIPIDELGFDFQVFTPEDSATLTEQGKPDRGAYVSGLFFQGAMWDPESDGCEGGGGKKAGAIRDSAPRVLFMPMPSFWLIVDKTVDVIERHTYTCPTYKTSMRQGQLSTTGHSTNYIMAIELPMRPDDTERKWVKAGVAMLAGLDD